MRGLTICQPYASLIANPPHDKRVENRAWPSGYRGLVLIHAGQSKEWLKSWRYAMPDPMPFGAVVAVAEIISCLHIESIRRDRIPKHLLPELAWLHTHPHVEGPYCYVLDKIRPLPRPIPTRGQQGFWVPDRELVEAVDAQLVPLVEAEIVARNQRA